LRLADFPCEQAIKHVVFNKRMFASDTRKAA
jgi:hypothetical protein